MKHVFLMHDTKRYHDLSIKIDKVMKTYDYEIVYQTSIYAIQKHIQKYTEKVRFYAVGGDGTLNGVIQSLVHTCHEVVLLPFGIGNDFCRMLTNEKDIMKILKKSLNQPASQIDTIRLNDHYYINAACFGVDRVIANHLRDIVNIPFVPQSKGYLVSIAQHIFQYKFDKVTLYSQNQCLFSGPVTLCAINNACYYGGGFPITPEAIIDDGYIDIRIVDKVPYRKMPRLLSLMLKRKLSTRKESHYFKVKEARVVCEQSCNMDGERIHESEYKFNIEPLSLNIVRWKNSEE